MWTPMQIIIFWFICTQAEECVTKNVNNVDNDDDNDTDLQVFLNLKPRMCSRPKSPTIYGMLATGNI